MNYFHRTAGQVSPGLADLHALADARAPKHAVIISTYDKSGDYRTGGLSPLVTVAEIEAALGFKANCEDDADKVTHSWGFRADGVPCGIWDYKGSRWSTFGPKRVFEKLFPGRCCS